MKYFSPEAALYLHKSTVRPFMEYCCHLWARAPKCHLDLLDHVQKRMYHLVSPTQPLSQRRNVTSLSLFYCKYHGKCSRELLSLVVDHYVAARLTDYSKRMHGSANVVTTTKKGFYERSSFPWTVRLCNSLPNEFFPEV